MAKFSLKDNLVVNYINNSREELRKVTWPSREKVIRDTLVVIGISLIIGAMFGSLDFGFNEGLQKLINLQ